MRSGDRRRVKRRSLSSGIGRVSLLKVKYLYASNEGRRAILVELHLLVLVFGLNVRDDSLYFLYHAGIFMGLAMSVWPIIAVTAT